MAVEVQEQYDSPSVSQGRQTRRYVAFADDASDNYAAVIEAVETQQPRTVDGLTRQPVRITGNPAPGYWFAELEHLDPEDPDNEDNDDEAQQVATYSVDTGGATAKAVIPLTNSVGYGPGGTTLPAIDVINGGDGVDIIVPQFEFSVTKKFPSSLITLPYLSNLHDLTGTINEVFWQGFDAQSVLFKGASLQSSEDPNKLIPITFKFAAEKTIENFEVKDNSGNIITVPTKYGWQYLEVKTRKAESSDGKTVKEVEAVYVHDVYPKTLFADLGLGL